MTTTFTVFTHLEALLSLLVESTIEIYDHTITLTQLEWIMTNLVAVP